MELAYNLISLVLPFAFLAIGFYVGRKETRQDAIEHGVGKYYMAGKKERFRWVCEASGEEERNHAN